MESRHGVWNNVNTVTAHNHDIGQEIGLFSEGLRDVGHRKNKNPRQGKTLVLFLSGHGDYNGAHGDMCLNPFPPVAVASFGPGIALEQCK